MKPAHVIAICALAVVLTLPGFVPPPMTHDSFWIDWVWADQFTAELTRGNLYPRWLPQSHGGLGSPVFYFYPPLGFYVSGLFGLASLPTYASIIAAFGTALAASGLAMLAFLKDKARNPLLGAMAYMVAPYHILDFYARGALGEFVAIALLPLIALGLQRAERGRIILLALSYAGLILAHLPLALLVSLFLILPWCLFRGIGTCLRAAVPLGLGIALAAVYLVPAFALDSYRDSGSLWNQPGYDAVTWSVLNWSAPGPLPDARNIIAAVLVSLVPAALVLLFSGQRRYGAYALACLALAAGLVPALWTLPLLSNVQFPFRILPLAEFAIAIGLAQLDWRAIRFWLGVTPALSVAVVAIAYHPPMHASIETLAHWHPDVPENLPPGERPYSWPSRWALAIADAHKAPRQVGAVTVDRVFYFPTWEVRCEGKAVPTWPDPETKLLSYLGRNCERRLVVSAAERAGVLISLTASLVVAAMAGWHLLLRRRRRRANGGRG